MVTLLSCDSVGGIYPEDMESEIRVSVVAKEAEKSCNKETLPSLVSFCKFQGDLGLTHTSHSAEMKFPSRPVTRLAGPEVFIESV